MSWLEKITDSERFEVRDRYNRNRLISQRKWIVLFYFSAYVLLSDKLNMQKEIGPLNFSNLTDEYIALAFLIANALIFAYSIIQIPSFLSNYPAYLRDTFANIRANEGIEDRETMDKLNTEAAESEKRAHELEIRQEDFANAYQAYQDEFGDRDLLDEDDERRARTIAENYGVPYKPHFLQSIERELRSIGRVRYQVSESLDRVYSDIASLNENIERGLSQRSENFKMYAITEVLTDTTRVLPTIVFGIMTIVLWAQNYYSVPPT
ncbi:hypothetical protein [Hyphomonas sp. KY3]|uniref:hypothetical protein n=1 Tax=Hyphomonas sp. KY3 TaxID=2016196 RepID=UPI000C5667BA|nr:hypothetical protein [Hyphomonas sp. KY3]MBG67513.1 hypothetical protein [Hyphomonas sp.]QSR20873.1 hypothetical protein CFA77_01040 [Hyphomonas sp. KY3]